MVRVRVVRRRGRRRRWSNRIKCRYDVYDGNDEMIYMLAMIRLVRIGWSCRRCLV